MKTIKNFLITTLLLLSSISIFAQTTQKGPTPIEKQISVPGILAYEVHNKYEDGFAGYWATVDSISFQFYQDSDKVGQIYNEYGNVILVDSGQTHALTSSKALFELKSTSKGFLPPRMTAAQRAAISSPPAGLVVYQSDSQTGLYVYNGSAWVLQSMGISGTVSQITSITTGVTLNSAKGLITTVAATAGAGGATPNTFTVTNSLVGATSNVKAYIVDYAGTIATNGTPLVQVDNRGSGTFDIIISNAHASNALNGVLVIGFEVTN